MALRHFGAPAFSGLLLSAGVAAEAPGRPAAEEPEELAFDAGTAARYAAALRAHQAGAATAAGRERGLAAAAKLPARVWPERTQHGEGYFAILGDWGNPFHPGTNDSAEAFWGPHWKCNTGQGDPVRCRRGSPEYERDEFAQVNVASALAAYASKNEVQFLVNLGDSLYPAGFDSPFDVRWQHVFEDRYAYDSLQVPWLSILGNHDWGGFDCYFRNGRLYRADSQIDYDTEHDWQWPQNKTSRWVMPNWYYKRRITFGSTTLDLFAIATNWVNEAESCGEIKYAQRRCDPHVCRAALHHMADTCWRFLETELPASDADWKLVIGHRPLESLGRWMSPHMNFVDLLRRNNVSMYIAGHRHSLEEHWVTPSDEVPFFHDGRTRPGSILEVVSGAGGGAYSDGEVQGFARWGFNGVKVTKTSLDVDYVSDSGKLMRTVRVDPPCAQLLGSRCAWKAGDWSPLEPCCEGPATRGCSLGLRTREVRCTGGLESHCVNSLRPNATEFCKPVTAAPSLRSTSTSTSSSTTVTATTTTTLTVSTTSTVTEGQFIGTHEASGDVGVTVAPSEPYEDTVSNGGFELLHWALPAAVVAITALITAAVACRCRRSRSANTDASAIAGAGGYHGPPRGNSAGVELPAGPTLLPRPPGARLPAGLQLDHKSPVKRTGEAAELEAAVGATRRPDESPKPPWPSPRLPEPTPRLPEEPQVVPQAPHVCKVQTSSMYFDLPAGSISTTTGGERALVEDGPAELEGRTTDCPMRPRAPGDPGAPARLMSI